MKTISILIVTLLITFQTYGQDCQVKLEAISGTYEGDCKKGLAQGSGKASGTDTYEGTFKKGLPDGNGTYTWANGDVYVGEFKKGVKSGAGKLTSADGTIDGYWADDEYIGKEKYPYKLLSADNNIADIQFSRKGSDKNQIVISYEKKGRRAEHGPINVKALLGNYGGLIQEPWTKTLTNVIYPIRFQVEGVERYDIVINQPGNWDVTVKLIAN